jgi:hydrogenase 3 maturation protease
MNAREKPKTDISKYIKGRAVIVGIGNTLKGDDGFGPVLISRLRGKTQASLFDCGEVPENYIQPIVKTNPETVIIVDASDWGGAAGEIRLLKNEEIGDAGFSTHNSSLRIFCDYLKKELHSANIVVIGVQIGSKDFMQPLSPEVETALCRLVKIFSKTP